MIKGISRRIIEVQETGSLYYERAYLVVKPEYDSAERQILEEEAKKILRDLDAPSTWKRRGIFRWKRAMWVLCALLTGGLLTALLIKFV